MVRGSTRPRPTGWLVALLAAAALAGCPGEGLVPADDDTTADDDATAADDDATADDDDTTAGDDDATAGDDDSAADCEHPSPAQQAALDAAVHAYLTEDDPAAAAASLDPLVELAAPLCFEHVAEAIRAWPAGPAALAPGHHVTSYPVEAAGMDGELHLFVPETADLASGARVPLFVVLHGAGGEGGGFWTHAPEIQQPVIAAGGVLASPTALEHCDWSAWELCADQVLSVLRHLKRRLPIDDDRVYLSGHSMGGRGSFTVGLTWPDRFAGLFPGAGTIGATADTLDVAHHQAYCTPHVENARHLRVALYTGLQDSAYLVAQNEGAAAAFDAFGHDFAWTADPAAGHGFPGHLWADEMAWVAAHARPRAPVDVVFDVAWHESNILEHLFLHEDLPEPVYWVRIDERLDATAPARIEGQVSEQLVALSTDGVGALTVLLSDDLVDLSLPARVEVDGAVWHDGVVAREPRVALTAARLRGERSMVTAAVLSGPVGGAGTSQPSFTAP